MAYATVEELAAALRITVTAANGASLQACLDAAAIEIDDAIDAPDAQWGSSSWLFSTSTAITDPGAGHLRLDGSVAAATTAAISSTDADGADWLDVLSLLQIDDQFAVLEQVGSAGVRYRITGPAPGSSWLALPIAVLSISGPPPKLNDGERVTVAFARPSTPVGNPLANRVNVLRAVEWFKANDAAFGVIGVSDTGTLQAPRNTMRRHQIELLPLKRQFGIS